MSQRKKPAEVRDGLAFKRRNTTSGSDVVYGMVDNDFQRFAHDVSHHHVIRGFQHANELQNNRFMRQVTVGRKNVAHNRAQQCGFLRQHIAGVTKVFRQCRVGQIRL
ncbi:hypothetical protein ESA_pESA3p05457 (plasmid) [Cronobacter sakazakii ATCC BAA-894]|uniref:Uncharacterized protein n=1 Tax=Cronobacter sakazakii (strain ATCC BAA-894) TaxID=290339 RepID=A7MRP9_CROS8|nr:hypothetical protein ESA_pESA3p05457 [Cronobacter sakazakii ATCC BAA-894]